MKIKTAYNNQDLINHLKDSKEVIKGLTDFDLDDEELERINKFKRLSQFEKDLIFLSSQYSIDTVAQLYCVSKSHIYNLLNITKEKLK